MLKSSIACCLNITLSTTDSVLYFSRIAPKTLLYEGGRISASEMSIPLKPCSVKTCEVGGLKCNLDYNH